jgi:hypothetical protein
MKTIQATAVAALCATAAWLPSQAAAQSADTWQFGAALNLYLPTVDGETTFPQGPVSGEAANLLKSLQGAFMGSFEARRGAWGGFTDIVYVNFGNSKSGTRDLSVGGIPLPADVSANVDFGLKGYAWTLAGTYRVLPDPNSPLDVLAGARQLHITESLDWQLSGNLGQIPLPGRGGSQEATAHNWDAIVGAKGRIGLDSARKWFVPYYVDIGAGDSSLTWQGVAGLGYAFGSVEVVASWRYLDYHMKSSKAVESLSFSGPAFSAVFHW